MAKKAVQTNAENLGYFNPPNVYRPEIIDIELVGEWNPEDGAINTYRITQNDGKIFDFFVKNGSGGSTGRGIVSIEEIETSLVSSGVNVIRVTFTDGTTSDFEVRNGAKGDKGNTGARGPVGVETVTAEIGTNNPSEAPSVDATIEEGELGLTFNNIKGAKGDKGDPGVDTENYVTVEATDQTTAVTDLLPATGAENTLYRVANWDGTQYDASVYSVYAWYNSAYKKLATIENGIDDEPTAGSENLVKSGGVAAQISQLGQKVDLGENTHIGTFVAAFEEENYAVTVTNATVKPTSVIPGQRIRVYVKSQALSRFAVYAYPASSATLLKEFPSETDFSGGVEFDFVCPSEMEQDSFGVTKILFRTWAEVTLEKFDCFRLEPNNSSSFDALKKSLDEEAFLLGGAVNLQPSKIDGEYIDNTGVVTSNANFSHTIPFFVPRGTDIKVTATGYTNVSIIARYNESDETYTPLVDSIDGTQREYTYTTESDCYLVISYDHRQPITINGASPCIYRRFDGTDQLVGVPSAIEPTIIAGKVINEKGVESDNANFSHTTPFAVTAGTKIKVSAAGYLATVSIISCYDTDLEEYKPLVVSEGSSVQNYEYTAPVAMYIVICFRSSTGYTHLFSIEPTPIIDSMPELSKKKGGINILAEFDNIVCAGDSLTYSQVYTQETSANSRQAKRPYPEVLSKLCGNDYTILASPGYNATQWWETFADQIVAKENPVAIIYLGTNNGLSDTLDTDVVGDDPDNWAENYTGDYCRIVNKFKTLGYKILLLKIWYTNAGGTRDLTHTNSAIEHIGERFGCAVMDVPRTKDLQYHYWPNLQGYNTIHYNDLGYAWFASKLIEDSGILPTEQMKFLIPD